MFIEESLHNFTKQATYIKAFSSCVILSKHFAMNTTTFDVSTESSYIHRWNFTEIQEGSNRDHWKSSNFNVFMTFCEKLFFYTSRQHVFLHECMFPKYVFEAILMCFSVSVVIRKNQTHANVRTTCNSQDILTHLDS